MSDPQLIQRQRQVLQELARLRADVAARLGSAEQAVRQRTEAAERERDQTHARLAQRAQAERAAAAQQRDETIRAARQKFETEHPAAQKAYEAAREGAGRQYDDALDRAVRAYEELRWTTSSVFEAKEKSATAPLAKVEQEVAAARLRLGELQEQAEAIVRGWHHGSVLSQVQCQPKANRRHEHPQKNLAATITEAEARIGALKALILPRIFKPAYLAGIVAALWAVLGAVLLSIYPDGQVAGKHHWLLVSGIGAFVIVLGVSGLLFAMARQKMYAAYKPVKTPLADAELTCDRWLQLETKNHQQRLAELAQAREHRDKQLRDAEQKHERNLAELVERRDEALRRTEAHYPALLKSLEESQTQGARQAEETYRKTIADSDARATAGRKEADARAQQQIAQARGELEQLRQKLTARQADAHDKLREAALQVVREIGKRFPPWNHPLWKNWRPPQGVPPVVRFGDMPVDIGGATSRWPALLPFQQRASVVFNARDDEGRAAGIAGLQMLMARLLTSLPAGKVRFTIVDPISLGENFSAFMHLADYDEALITNRIWTEPRQIDQRLADIAAHMENVIQKYLRNQYASIEEYNAKAGEVAEPYRVLVIANFPANFTGDAARRLTSIVTSGPSCGVCTLVSVDPRQRMPDDFNLADLERACATMTWKDGRFVWQDPDFGPLPLQLDSPPDGPLLNQLLHAAGTAAQQASRVEVSFDFIAPPPSEWWTKSSQDGLEVPLGRAGATKRQCLRLGQGTAQHGLVAGKTGSGKSTLFHVLITNLGLLYSPDELELYLVDFKKGVEFKSYATHRLPHARVIAVESEREFGLSVLQRLDAELRHRGDEFRRIGVPNVSEYRAKSGKPCPRIVLLVDEFQEFFVEDDRLAQDAALLLDRLVRQGRAFGLHVLLGSQTLGGAYTLARSTIDQMAVRIALQCSEADAHLILSKDNAAARLLSRPGEAIYNDANGLVEGNDVFQIVWLEDDRREQLLDQLQRMSTARRRSAPTPLVFEGNIPADVRANGAFRQALAAPAWSASVPAPNAWLGEAIAIKDPTAAVFRRQTSNNLLIIGHVEEPALGLLATAVVGLATQQAPVPEDGGSAASARFLVLDGSPADSPYAGTWTKLASVLPHGLRVGGWRDVPTLLAEVAAELDRRQKANDVEAPSIYTIIHGLHRFRDLRKGDDDFSYSRRGGDAPVAPAKLFETILREGPSVGVHTLIWVDGLTSLQRVCDRAMMRDFALRVLFPMSVNDSSFLIDSPQASKLGPHRALFASEDSGQVEKFRPYGIPEEKWLREVGERLGSKRLAARPPVVST